MSIARRLSVAAALALALVPRPAAAQQFTVEQVLAAPFPSALVAAPTGARIAWVQNAEGVRNIWVAEGPRFTARQLTSYTADDGQDLGDLTWTPDGHAIVYVRGGGPNRQGEIPNPTSDPQGATQELWIVPFATGGPLRLAEGNAPAVSPRGDVIAFLRRGEVWAIMRQDSTQPKKLFTIRGRASQLRFSPDGAMLAFVSARSDHSFVGLYDFGLGGLRYLDPTVDRDGSPTWSPDGRRLAFLRTPNERDRLPFFAQREAEPWSIHVVDLTTGDARTAFRAERGRGSAFRGVVAENQILWTEGDWLVFPWERTGWTNLYAVSARGGAARPVAAGAFEVEHVALSPDRRTIVYASNAGDIDRRHVSRITVRDWDVQPVTSGAGIEWSPVVTGDNRAIAFLASDARTPAHAAIRVGDETRRPLAPETLPRDFPVRHLLEPQAVTFRAADGVEVRGQLFAPRTARAGERRPAVLFFHGGSRRQMLLGWHYIGYYHHAYALNQYLASRGYVVLSVNYRSGTGYGLEFREALQYGAEGASEFRDVLAAADFLKTRPDVDPARIGLWGGSYGGYLTALGLARASDTFRAGVDLHGVHDWNVVIENFAPDYDKTVRPELARVAFQSSPLADVATWRSPVLVIHGDDDRNVPFSETVDLVEALRGQGVEVEQLIFPDEVHGFLLHRNWVAAYRAAAAFLDRRLK